MILDTRDSFDKNKHDTEKGLLMGSPEKPSPRSCNYVSLTNNSIVDTSGMHLRAREVNFFSKKSNPTAVCGLNINFVFSFNKLNCYN